MVTYGFTVAGDRAASLEGTIFGGFYRPPNNIWGGIGTIPSSTTARKPQATLAFDNRISNDLFCSAIKIQQHPTLTKPTSVVSAYGFTSPAVATSAAIEFLAMPGNTSDSMNITITTNLIVKPEQTGSYSWPAQLHKASIPTTSSEQLQNIFQPIPTAFGQIDVIEGGDMLGFGQFKDTLVCMQKIINHLTKVLVAYIRPSNVTWHKMARATMICSNQVTMLLASLNQNRFIYLDDACKMQKLLKSYETANIKKI
ncbi:hypothetical protein BTUL_0061g00490 [Botrytis tulipae]|uniref:Uncharacterized protein n=1 Tax=Botrytis tulipae TaxID=87230 RepID=A0A4Z1ENS7_9HELO|nr:hypothetical protein BTUL_0061g00490 [Botrytis tulipae]